MPKLLPQLSSTRKDRQSSTCIVKFNDLTTAGQTAVRLSQIQDEVCVMYLHRGKTRWSKLGYKAETRLHFSLLIPFCQRTHSLQSFYVLMQQRGDFDIWEYIQHRISFINIKSSLKIPVPASSRFTSTMTTIFLKRTPPPPVKLSS